jgi:hypothetical protein
MTIWGNRIKKLMDTDRYHQGESIKSKESASARTQPRNFQIRGRVPKPQTTQEREDQEYEKGDQSDQEDHESTGSKPSPERSSWEKALFLVSLLPRRERANYAVISTVTVPVKYSVLKFWNARQSRLKVCCIGPKGPLAGCRA